MKFFTAGDILQYVEEPSPDVFTIDRSQTVQEALSLMLEHDFDQVPVTNNGDVVGAITYKSIARLCKSAPDSNLENMTVMGGLMQPTYVDTSHDIFDLFETFAVEEFVLVGESEEVRGIITRYDVFHFLKHQFEPFIMIGEIEQSLREIFRTQVQNIESKIEETFKKREENDPGYLAPESLDHFNFSEYMRFLVVNIDEMPEEIQQDKEFVKDLLDAVRRERNALFHFRSTIDDIDRDVIEVAHGYFTGFVG